jgi:hypothetical protein
MPLNKEAQDTLRAAVNGWFKNFAGTSALDVARDLSLDHAVVMQLFEHLATAGYGSLNKDVRLYQMSFDPENISAGFKNEVVVTHIFFPSKQVLRNAFYSSDLPKQHLPEYTTRLHLGAHQIGLAYFGEEVLARYLDHPELYEINDSLAGAEISSMSSRPEDRYLYVRYGKCRLKSGHIAVTAIYKDLSDMGNSEQRYWHSHEIDSPAIDKSDVHFQSFLARTYEGDFVDFQNPIARLLEAVAQVNKVFEPRLLFAKAENVHIRLPVGQTYKSYCDAASELYKIVGPDNMSQSSLKNLLTNDFGVQANDLVHTESARPLSTLQLFALLEDKLGNPGLFTEPLRMIGHLRVTADHKVLKPDAVTKSYSRDFAQMCDSLAQALERFAELVLRMRRGKT